MSPLSEVFGLVIYATQQFGVMLGVGAQTIILAVHLLGMQARPEGVGFVNAVRKARGIGLLLMVVSGVGAIGLHMQLGATEVLFAPAFLFKWILIILLTALHYADGTTWHRNKVEGLAGGSWYALFLVHTLAPVTVWPNIILLYVLWLGVFSTGWWLCLTLMRHGHAAFSSAPTIAPAPAIASLAPLMPKQETPRPVVAPTPAPKPVTPPAPPKIAAPLFKPIAAAVRPVLTPVVTAAAAPPVPAPASAAPPILKPALSITPAPVVAAPPNLPVARPIALATPEPPKLTVAKTLIIEKQPEKPLPVAPTPEKDHGINWFFLPALHIMPKKPEDMDARHRAPVAKLA